MKNKTWKVLGIDLAGVAHRPSGVCLLEGQKALTRLLFADREIVDFVRREAPDLVAIDAPLNLPPGRKSMSEENGVHFRPCDIELRRRKIRFFPITLGPMRDLTERGIRLKQILEESGFRVVEIYPGGAQDVWHIPRAKRSLAGLKMGLARRGIQGLRNDITDHELDAVSGALVGRLYLQGKADVLGDFSSGAIIMPKSRPCAWNYTDKRLE
jgi:predicted nuclease with RNAse H fold